MKEYHLVWLAAHPDRSQEWLRGQLADGFDVHHVDGDQGNNKPENLVLIDGADHMMLHNTKSRLVRGLGGKRKLRVTELVDGQIVKLLPRERASSARRRCAVFGVPPHRVVGEKDQQAYRLVFC